MTINIEITNTPPIGLLSGIHRHSFSIGWDERALAELMAMPGSMAFVADKDKGFALLRLLGEEAEILTLAVLTPYRQTGIGRALVSAMLAWGQERGAKTFFLEVRQSNLAAQALYGKLGFATLSRRKGYYRNADGSSEDAITMRHQR